MGADILITLLAAETRQGEGYGQCYYVKEIQESDLGHYLRSEDIRVEDRPRNDQ